jgi:hypothetical protein
VSLNPAMSASNNASSVFPPSPRTRDKREASSPSRCSIGIAPPPGMLPSLGGEQHMATARPHAPGLTVRPEQPLIGVVLVEDGQEVDRFFADEADADAAVAAQTAADARALAGAWGAFDWEETVEELDRIRHETTPTPPIDDL